MVTEVYTWINVQSGTVTIHIDNYSRHEGGAIPIQEQLPGPQGIGTELRADILKLRQDRMKPLEMRKYLEDGVRQRNPQWTDGQVSAATPNCLGIRSVVATQKSAIRATAGKIAGKPKGKTLDQLDQVDTFVMKILATKGQGGPQVLYYRAADATAANFKGEAALHLFIALDEIQSGAWLSEDGDSPLLKHLLLGSDAKSAFILGDIKVVFLCRLGENLPARNRPGMPNSNCAHPAVIAITTDETEQLFKELYESAQDWAPCKVDGCRSQRRRIQINRGFKIERACSHAGRSRCEVFNADLHAAHTSFVLSIGGCVNICNFHDSKAVLVRSLWSISNNNPFLSLSYHEPSPFFYH